MKLSMIFEQAVFRGDAELAVPWLRRIPRRGSAIEWR